MSAALDDLMPDEMAALADSDFGRESPAPLGGPDLDAWIDARLAVIAGLVAAQAGNAEVAERRMAMIASWRDEQNASIQRNIDWLTDQLRVVARSYRYPKGKSRKLPCGEIGLRASRAKLEVLDAAVALAFARAHEIPVQVKESVTATALKEYAESTGETPDGCEYRAGGQDEPYVRIRGE